MEVNPCKCIYCHCSLDGINNYIEHLKTCEPIELSIMNGRDLPRLAMLRTPSKDWIKSDSSKASTSSAVESFSNTIMEDMLRYKKEFLRNSDSEEDGKDKEILKNVALDEPEVSVVFEEMCKTRKTSNAIADKAKMVRERRVREKISSLQAIAPVPSNEVISSRNVAYRELNMEEKPQILATNQSSSSVFPTVWGSVSADNKELLSLRLRCLLEKIFSTFPNEDRKSYSMKIEDICKKFMVLEGEIQVRSVKCGDKIQLLITRVNKKQDGKGEAQSNWNTGEIGGGVRIKQEKDVQEVASPEDHSNEDTLRRDDQNVICTMATREESMEGVNSEIDEKPAVDMQLERGNLRPRKRYRRGSGWVHQKKIRAMPPRKEKSDVEDESELQEVGRQRGRPSRSLQKMGVVSLQERERIATQEGSTTIPRTVPRTRSRSRSLEGRPEILPADGVDLDDLESVEQARKKQSIQESSASRTCSESFSPTTHRIPGAGKEESGKSLERSDAPTTAKELLQAADIFKISEICTMPLASWTENRQESTSQSNSGNAKVATKEEEEDEVQLLESDIENEVVVVMQKVDSFWKKINISRAAIKKNIMNMFEFNLKKRGAGEEDGGKSLERSEAATTATESLQERRKISSECPLQVVTLSDSDESDVVICSRDNETAVKGIQTHVVESCVGRDAGEGREKKIKENLEKRKSEDLCTIRRSCRRRMEVERYNMVDWEIAKWLDEKRTYCRKGKGSRMMVDQSKGRSSAGMESHGEGTVASGTAVYVNESTIG